MVQKLLHKVLGDDKFVSIEVQLRDDSVAYQVTEVERKDDSLSITSSRRFDDFENLLESIAKNRPTLLSFTGNGIISKKVEHIPNYRSKLLFNANAEDFYWYQLTQSEYIFASVIRKSVIDVELERFQKHQIFIVDISIGPLIVSALKPLLPKLSELRTEKFELQFEDDEISNFSKYQYEDEGAFYQVGDEKIALKDIVPFSNLLNYLFPNDKIDTENDFLETSREEFKFRKAFNTAGMIALPTFLVALLISYIFLNYYQQEYIELQVAIEEESIAYNKLVLLENDRDNKEAILKESGLNDSNFLSFYISEIAKEIPQEINLVALEVFSPSVKIKPSQRIFFNNDTIEIVGETTSNDAFANWIKKIKEHQWIENLEIVDFRKDGNRTSNFVIRLKLKFNV